MKKLRELLNLSIFVVLITFTSCEVDNPVATAETQKSEPQAQAEPLPEPMPEPMPEPVTTSFNITIKNVVQYLNAQVFNTHNNATQPGPIPDPGCFYTIDFKAVPPGGKLSFATMSVVSNDWFFAPKAEGITLFEDGMPVTGDVTDQVYLWDAGVEEEDPATRTSEPDGATNGEPDDDDTVRIVTTDVAEFVKIYLDYDEASSYFTLKIENVRGNKVETDPIVITPGIVVIHAQDNALFEPGQPDSGHGLAKIAVQGDPSDIHAWLTATCDNGAPLRLSSSFTVFAPGIVYAYDADYDPVFVQGEPAVAGSGIEEIAEDGNSGIMFEYITNELGFYAAQSNEMMPVGPGGSLTFTLEAPVGYKLGFNTMFVFSNDWFISSDNGGYHLFNGDGSPRTGSEITHQAYLYDAGTEIDQPVGLGPDQAPFQSGPNTGAADDNNLIRRVMEIDDVQFGKGPIHSYEGVAGHPDLRGGYNLVHITIEAN
jgi:hypothetical protein